MLSFWIKVLSSNSSLRVNELICVWRIEICSEKCWWETLSSTSPPGQTFSTCINFQHILHCNIFDDKGFCKVLMLRFCNLGSCNPNIQRSKQQYHEIRTLSIDLLCLLPFHLGWWKQIDFGQSAVVSSTRLVTFRITPPLNSWNEGSRWDQVFVCFQKIHQRFVYILT